MDLNKDTFANAMMLSGYDDWRPNFDVPNLKRPRRRPSQLPGNGKFAAVLLLIYECKDGQPCLILTRRRNDMSKHPGQISLPGGRQDDGESLLQTALRESSEEIGVEANAINILGELNPVYIPPSDFTVTPFVGWHEGPPDFTAAEYEVAEILEVPVLKLLDPETLIHGEVKTWNKQDPSRPDRILAPFYAVGKHQVWGATAIMLDEFLDRLRSVRQ